MLALGKWALGAGISWCPLSLGTGVPRGGVGGAELPGLARTPPPPPGRGFLIAAFPPRGIPAVLVWSSGALRMERNPKNEMQPWRTLQCCCSYWDLGRRGEETGSAKIFLIPLPERPFCPSLIKGSSSSLCTFLSHPPQDLILDPWVSQETSAAALLLSTRN